MIVDTSAFVAILKREPEQAAFSRLLEVTQQVSMSAATYLEASIVIDALRQPTASRALDDLIERSKIIIEPVTVEQAKIARQAYRDYGKGGPSRQPQLRRLLQLRPGPRKTRAHSLQGRRLRPHRHSLGGTTTA